MNNGPYSTGIPLIKILTFLFSINTHDINYNAISYYTFSDIKIIFHIHVHLGTKMGQIIFIHNYIISHIS